MSELSTHRLCDVVFTCPAEWVVEPVPGLRGVIAMHPELERRWRANVMIELVRRRPGRTIAESLDRLCETLAETQRGLHVRRRAVVRRPSGGVVASVEYDALQDEIALTQLDMLWHAAPDQNLHLTASAECTLWPRYEPVFDSILASVCSPDEVVGAALGGGAAGREPDPR
jgi:hypothetical protein